MHSSGKSKSLPLPMRLSVWPVAAALTLLFLGTVVRLTALNQNFLTRRVEKSGYLHRLTEKLEKDVHTLALTHGVSESSVSFLPGNERIREDLRREIFSLYRPAPGADTDALAEDLRQAFRVRGEPVDEAFIGRCAATYKADLLPESLRDFAKSLAAKEGRISELQIWAAVLTAALIALWVFLCDGVALARNLKTAVLLSAALDAAAGAALKIFGERFLGAWTQTALGADCLARVVLWLLAGAGAVLAAGILLAVLHRALVTREKRLYPPKGPYHLIEEV